jgi:hypothetical protein
MVKFSNWISVLIAVVAFYAAPILTTAASAEEARIDLQVGKVGFIVGFSGGKGVITYKDKTYPVRVGGVSLGATFALTSIDLTGTVSNFSRIEDIYGNYTAASAGLAVVAGGKAAKLENTRGVIMEVGGRSIGVEFSLDLAGISVKPR